MNLEEIAACWRPGPVEDEATPDAAVAGAVAGLWGVEPPRVTIPPLWHWFHLVDWVPHE